MVMERRNANEKVLQINGKPLSLFCMHLVIRTEVTCPANSKHSSMISFRNGFFICVIQGQTTKTTFLKTTA